MTLNEYQKLAKRTSGKVLVSGDYIYPTLGMVSEAGEFAGKVKKIFRDNGGKMNKETKEALIYELGDVLWYVSEIASKLKVGLDEVAKLNIEKLASRKNRGKLFGSGDKR